MNDNLKQRFLEWRAGWRVDVEVEGDHVRSNVWGGAGAATIEDLVVARGVVLAVQANPQWDRWVELDDGSLFSITLLEHRPMLKTARVEVDFAHGECNLRVVLDFEEDEEEEEDEDEDEDEEELDKEKVAALAAGYLQAKLAALKAAKAAAR
jgi:hypothetical protein